MPKKTLIAACALALAALLAAFPGCAANSQTSSAGSTAKDLTPVTFVLDYTPNTNHTGIYVAKELGYYADAGLDVTIVQPPDDGADALVGSGMAQFGMSYQDIMANYLGSDEPLPVTAVAAVVQHNTSGIVSRQGEGLDRPSGMAGHSYGTWDQDVEKAILKSIVETDGGNWSDVQLVPCNSTDEISGLRANMFDSIWCYEGWALQNAKIQDYPVDYFSLRDIDETFDYYTPVIIANDDFLFEDPQAAAAFLQATQKGYEYAVEHPREAAEILLEAAPEIDSELALESQEFLAEQYIADAPQWGYIDPERWNRFYEWMNFQGLTPLAIPEDTGFTNEYLPQSK